MKLRPSSLSVAVEGSSSDDVWTATVSCDAVALYVTLTTAADGHFDANAVLVRPPGRSFRFVPSGNRSEEAFNLFKQSLRVEDVATYRFLQS